MTTKPKPRRRSRLQDTNAPHLAILVEHRPGGFEHTHAGIARGRRGTTMCSNQILPVFGIPAEDPNFALHLRDGWRHRYAEAFLELNRGCPRCLEVLYAIAREVGWAKPKSLERS